MKKNIYRKHEAVAFRQANEPFKVSEAMKPENVHTNTAVADSSIRLQAYLIHSEKGGDALDNWLEAEQILQNRNSAGELSFINEGNPNTQNKIMADTKKI